MLYKISFEQFDFVDNRNIIKEPIEKETNLPQHPKNLQQPILVIQQNLNKFLILNNTLKQPKQLTGILNRFYPYKNAKITEEGLEL